MDDPNFDLHQDMRLCQILQDMAVRLNQAEAENGHLKLLLNNNDDDDVSSSRGEPQQQDEKSDLVEATKVLATNLLDLLNGKDNDETVVKSLQTMKDLLCRNDIIPSISSETASVSDETTFMIEYSCDSNHDEEDNSSCGGGCWRNSPTKSPEASNGPLKRISLTDDEYYHDPNLPESFSNLTQSLALATEDMDLNYNDHSNNIIVKQSFAHRLLRELRWTEEQCFSYMDRNTVGSSYYCVVSADRLLQVSSMLMNEREDYIETLLHILAAFKEDNDNSTMELIGQDEHDNEYMD